MSIVDRQIGELSQLADDIMIVGWSEARKPRITRRPGTTSSSIRIVADRIKDSGPLGGLDAALAAAKSDAVIVLACDMPFVTARFLEYLISVARDAEAVVPRTKRGYHPLCALYTRGCRAAVARSLAEGRLAMVELLETIRVRAVEEHEIERFGQSDRLLANVNSPAEFDELEALRGHKL